MIFQFALCGSIIVSYRSQLSLHYYYVDSLQITIDCWLSISVQTDHINKDYITFSVCLLHSTQHIGSEKLPYDVVSFFHKIEGHNNYWIHSLIGVNQLIVSSTNNKLITPTTTPTKLYFLSYRKTYSHQTGNIESSVFYRYAYGYILCWRAQHLLYYLL